MEKNEKEAVLGCLFLAVALLIVILFVAGIIKSCHGNASVSLAPSAAPALDYQQQQAQVITDEAVAQDLVYKIDASDHEYIRIYVTDSFVAMPLDRKEQFAQITYNRYFPRGGTGDDMVVFIDFRSGKSLGRITRNGFTWD